MAVVTPPPLCAAARSWQAMAYAADDGIQELRREVEHWRTVYHAAIDAASVLASQVDARDRAIVALRDELRARSGVPKDVEGVLVGDQP